MNIGHGPKNEAELNKLRCLFPDQRFDPGKIAVQEVELKIPNPFAILFRGFRIAFYRLTALTARSLI